MLVIIIKNQCHGCRGKHFDTFDTDTLTPLFTPVVFNASSELREGIEGADIYMADGIGCIVVDVIE